MRLIDADALKQEIIQLREKVKQSGWWDEEERAFIAGEGDGLIEAEHLTTTAPTVEAIPMERDVPKKPTDKLLEEDAYGAIGNVYGQCPNCHGTVYSEQNYCEVCGQRLDWSTDNGK